MRIVSIQGHTQYAGLMLARRWSVERQPANVMQALNKVRVQPADMLADCHHATGTQIGGTGAKAQHAWHVEASRFEFLWQACRLPIVFTMRAGSSLTHTAQLLFGLCGHVED